MFSFLVYSLGLHVHVVATKKWSIPFHSFSVNGNAGDAICSARFARCVSDGTIIVATAKGALKAIIASPGSTLAEYWGNLE